MHATLLLAVRTGPHGRALFGTVSLETSQKVREGLFDRFKREPGAAAAPHHPKVATLLTVLEGQHTIFIAGTPEQSVTLTPGQQILFCDFAPETQPAEGYSGHRSVAGPEGALLFRVMSTDPPDLDAMGWQEGLPTDA